MVRVGDAHVGGGAGGDVGDNVVVDVAVVGVQPQVHGDVGVQPLELRNGLAVDVRLELVGVVFRPEGDFIVVLGKAVGHGKGRPLLAAVAARRREAQQHRQRQAKAFVSHPLVPPWETPSIIFLRKARNSRISGTEMTTTAAIMAGMFSRPKPFSRISWMPLDTR